MATAALNPLVYYIQSVGPPEPDGALLARFACDGDETAFAELVRRHGPAVLGVCRRTLRDPHAADDAFQVTFLLLAKKAGDLRQPNLLASWLYGVACRTAMKLRSRLARRQTRELAFDEAAFVSPGVPDADLGPELDAAIQQLPSKYRVPFVLCHLQGLTNAEAARRLGCPPNTVATRLSRARERLRTRLTRQGLTAAVSSVLIAAAARNAAALTAGGSLPPDLLTLMEGVRNAMMWKKAKLVVVAIAVLVATGIGAGRLTFRAGAEEPPRIPKTAPEADAAPNRIPATEVSATRDEAKVRNFVVEGTTDENARRIGVVAEKARKDFAKLWLGRELPDWKQPCSIRVTITADKASGVSTFDFRERPIHMRMEQRGPLDKLLSDSVPHEVAHTVLADYFGVPVPRWADEGVAIMCECNAEHARHEAMLRQLLNSGRAFRLTFLFGLKEYPQDAMTLYAQGYSVTRFLVEKVSHAKFVEFVKTGMKDGWDSAARSCYDATPAELEKEWLESLRKPRKDASLIPADAPNVAFTSGPPPSKNPPTTPQQPPLMPESTVPPPAVPSSAIAEPQPVYVPESGRFVDSVQPGLTVVQASLDKNGMIVCTFPKIHHAEPVTSYRRDEYGSSQPVTSYVYKAVQEERSYRPEMLLVSDTDGKPVDAKGLAKRLKTATAVLFVSAGRVDPLLLPLLKEGTLIVSINIHAPLPHGSPVSNDPPAQTPEPPVSR